MAEKGAQWSGSWLLVLEVPHDASMGRRISVTLIAYSERCVEVFREEFIFICDRLYGSVGNQCAAR